MRLGPAGDGPEEGGNGERLWKKIVAGVVPLAKTRHKRHAAAAAAPPAKPAAPMAAAPNLPPAKPQRMRPAPPLPPPPAPKGPAPLVPGGLAGVDRRTGERLRKGRMAVEAKLDLHGMSQHQAHGAVARFIAGQQAAGARCVLIVTGKGGRTADPLEKKSLAARFTFGAGRGVLKEALPRWLNEPALRALIVAVTAARPDHGGSGAVYVLLKRKRG